MVTVGEDHQPQVERLFIDVLRWQHLEVDVSDCNSLEAVGIATSRQLTGVLESDAQVPRAVRVSLKGESPIHGELFQRERELRAHVLAEIAAIAPERLWLEKVKLATRPVAAQTGDTVGGDALAELEALLTEARHDNALLKELREDFNQMLAKAPYLLAEVPALKQVRDGDLDGLLDHVLPGLLARLAMKN